MAIGMALAGGAMAAGGGLLTAKAMGINGTGPKKAQYNYGGSSDAANQYRGDYASQLNNGRSLQDQGINRLNTLAMQNQYSTQDLVKGAQSLQQQAGNWSVGDVGQGYLAGYDPGAVAKQQAAAALQQNARMNLGAARGIGGAAAMRNALQSNAMAGIQVAPQVAAAMADARNQQALMQQQAQLAQTQLGQNAQQASMANQLNAFQLQNQAVRQGQGVGLDITSGILGAGAQREGNYLGAQQQLEGQQLQAQMAYDQARMADKQQKRAILGGIGGSLIGSGASMMQSGMGGR